RVLFRSGLSGDCGGAAFAGAGAGAWADKPTARPTRITVDQKPFVFSVIGRLYPYSSPSSARSPMGGAGIASPIGDGADSCPWTGPVASPGTPLPERPRRPPRRRRRFTASTRPAASVAVVVVRV